MRSGRIRSGFYLGPDFFGQRVTSTQPGFSTFSLKNSVYVSNILNPKSFVEVNIRSYYNFSYCCIKLKEIFPFRISRKLSKMIFLSLRWRQLGDFAKLIAKGLQNVIIR